MTCTFRVDRLDRLREMEASHFWFVSRRALVRDLVRRHVPPTSVVVDVGCGTGDTLTYALREGMVGVGVDGRREGLVGRGPVACAQGDVERLPLADACADAVLALDVLEHVDDRVALAEVRRVLRPGGVLVVTVPAFSFLWSHRDDDAGHLRRYTPRQLRRALDEAGLPATSVTFFQCALFPVVAAMRLGGRGRVAVRDAEDRPPGALNAAMTWIGLAEVAAIRAGARLPWGSSLVAVAHLPTGAPR